MNPLTPPAPVRAPRGLAAILRPRTVALIGASDRADSVGRALMNNLHGFPGELYPVNPGHDFIGDHRAYACIADTPEPVDLAVIAVHADRVAGVVRECVAAKVAGAVIISAGFRECGAAGAERERQVLAGIRRGSLRIVGPNSLGVMNPHAGLNASFAVTTPRPGQIAFLSQSGALCSAVLDWSRRENVGFSAFVSTGSMLDIGWGELIDYLAHDPQTQSILLYMESVEDAHSFLAAARRAVRTKPVIALKAGRTAEAARAASSHSGAMIGRDEVFEVALERAGVLRVDTVAELFGIADVLARQPLPRGRRLAIVTNAGGPGALATDALMLAGGSLAPLSPPTLAALNDLLPAHWSHGNPIDVLGDAKPGRFLRAVEFAVQDPETDGLMAILTPQSMTDPTAVAGALPAVPGVSAKPCFACWMGGDTVAEGRQLLHEARIPVFPVPEDAAKAFCQLARLAELHRNQRAHESPIPAFAPTDDAAVMALIANARASGRTLLSEYESKQLVGGYGIGSVDTRLAANADEAVAIAARIGYPVVVKLHSHTLTHKADVEGVRLDLRDEAAVRQAWHDIHHAVGEKIGREHFLGVTVQPMIREASCELILGSTADPIFGPVLLFGAGGSQAEIFQDRSLGLPPLDASLARRMVERTRISAVLRSARIQPPVDLDQLDLLMVQFSRLVTAHPDIKDIEINPLLWSRGRFLALDARVILQPPGTTPVGPALAPARVRSHASHSPFPHHHEHDPTHSTSPLRAR